VYSASSSKASVQSLPQKRRTLSTGLSQYQHEPFGGRLTREGLACTAAAGGDSEAAPSFITLSCIVSKVHSLRQHVKSSSKITVVEHAEHEQSQWQFRCGSAATAVMNTQCAPNPPLPQRRYAHPAALAASLQQIACPPPRSHKKRCQLQKS
jgi:hypothetical protein